jgi:hypothetical protein
VGVATQMIEVWDWVMEVVEKLQLPLEIRQEFQERRVWIPTPIWYFVRRCAALATSSIARRLIRVDLGVQDAGITRRLLMVALGSASVDRCPRLISGTRSSVFPVPFSSSRTPFAPLTAAPSAPSPLRPSPICAERWYGYPLNRHRRPQQTHCRTHLRFLPRGAVSSRYHPSSPCSSFARQAPWWIDLTLDSVMLGDNSLTRIPFADVKEDWVPWNWV